MISALNAQNCLFCLVGITVCAVFGVLAPARNKELAQRSFVQQQASLNKRGPDDSGFLEVNQENNCFLLGHNRLAILGNATSAKQPTTSPSGVWSLSFNGQIYNYRQLAAQLKIPQADLPELTDTQVLLYALEKWGISMLSRLDGMFACAIFNSLEKKLWLVRDESGIKPLFYAHDQRSGVLLFASQLTAILHTPLLACTVNQSAVAQFLRWGTILPPQTIVNEIHAVEPGQLLCFSTDILQQAPTVMRFVDFAAQRPQKAAGTTPDFLENLRQTAPPAADVGLFLSSGVDSVGIAHGLKALGFANVHTFTAKYSAFKGCVDESLQAQKIAHSLGFKHEQITLDSTSLRDNFYDFVSALNQPSTDGFNTFMISRLAAQRVKIALSGLGGDELFFGYRHMRQLVWAQQNPKLVQGIHTLSRIFKNNRWWRKLLFLRDSDFVPQFLPDASPFFSILNARQLLDDDDFARFGLTLPKPLTPQYAACSEKLQWSELAAYTMPVLLADSDCLSMCHSLELRVPFLNPTFVRKLLGVPIDQHLAKTQWPNKPLLCELLANFTPPELLRLPKTGFVLPLGHWILRELQPQIAELLASNFLPQPWLRVQLQQLEKTPWDWRKFWGVLVLYNWMKTHMLQVSE